MDKNLITLNDFVDGYLGAILDEPESNIQLGKKDFVEKFRTLIAVGPSNKEGDELVKQLNRILMKASMVPRDLSLNRKHGFDEALATIKTKIQDLFQIENMNMGTISGYLEDVPKIPISKKKGFPKADEIFNESSTDKDQTDAIERVAADVRKNIESQLEVLKRHENNNGRLIVISDEGYTELDEIDGDALGSLVEGSKRSLKELDKMVSTAVSMIKQVQKLKDRSKDSSNDDLKPKSDEDILRDILGLNGDPEDED